MTIQEAIKTVKTLKENAEVSQDEWFQLYQEAKEEPYKSTYDKEFNFHLGKTLAYQSALDILSMIKEDK